MMFQKDLTWSCSSQLIFSLFISLTTQILKWVTSVHCFFINLLKYELSIHHNPEKNKFKYNARLPILTITHPTILLNMSHVIICGILHFSKIATAIFLVLQVLWELCQYPSRGSLFPLPLGRPMTTLTSII